MVGSPSGADKVSRPGWSHCRSGGAGLTYTDGALPPMHCAGGAACTYKPLARTRDTHVRPRQQVADAAGDPDRGRVPPHDRRRPAAGRHQAAVDPAVRAHPCGQRVHRGRRLRPAGGAGLLRLAAAFGLLRARPRHRRAGPDQHPGQLHLRLDVVHAPHLREPGPAQQARLRLAAQRLAVRGRPQAQPAQRRGRRRDRPGRLRRAQGLPAAAPAGARLCWPSTRWPPRPSRCC